MSELRIGTSAFTAAGLENAFYPAGMKPADYLTCYATTFHTLAVDSTFYRTPSVATVNRWARKVPEGFLLAAKVPQVLTHEKILRDCETDSKKLFRDNGFAGREARATSFSVRIFQQIGFQERQGISRATRTIPEETSPGIQIRFGDP
jgi:uncharacterized protein YecE (DUF72 family)